MSDLYRAKYFKKENEKTLRCTLCPHYCLIKDSKTGICQVRKNIDGKLYSLNYSQISSLSIDPVEKKPLYHYYPGEKVLSIGSWGCNLSCSFCQNWQISQKKPSIKEYQPQEIVDYALENNIKLIAYTYSEPIVFYEYMLKTAKIAQKNGIKNIMVSNGFINQKAFRELVPFIEAANIDLKAFNDQFYQKKCNGALEAVKNTIEIAAAKIHLEITNLIIRDLNDNLKELEKMFKWLAAVNKNIPLHLSRYYPAYKLNNRATDLQVMKKSYLKAKNHLNHVYLGNAIVNNTADSFCSNCGQKIIERKKYEIKNYLKKEKCPNCGEIIYGKFGRL